MRSTAGCKFCQWFHRYIFQWYWMNHPSAQRLITSILFMILTFSLLKWRSNEQVCRVGDTRHLKCTGESIVQQIDPEEREKRDYGVLWRKIGKGTMCVHNTKTVTHRASEAWTFPQRLRHASCGWSRLTASRLSLLAPERLWGRGKGTG